MDNINKNEKFRVLSTIAITISFILNFGLFISSYLVNKFDG